MSTFPWDLPLGNFRVALSFGDLLMRIFRVHDWKLSFGIFRLGSFDLKRSFGNFRFGTAASFFVWGVPWPQSPGVFAR